MVTIENSAAKLNRQALARFARQAQRAVRLRGDVEVLITTSPRMQALNRAFRKKNKPTDVLSFPATEIPTVNGRHCAGDIAISAQIAGRNARQYGHSIEDEIKVLILHGLLHLAGYDHEGDNGRMARREGWL